MEQIKNEKDDKFINENCYNIEQLQQVLKCGYKEAYETIKSSFSSAFMHKHKWYVPIADVEEYEKNNNNIKIPEGEYYTVAELMKMWDCSRNIVCKKLDLYFPSAFIHKNKWYVPIADVKEYEKNNKNIKIPEGEYYTVNELLDMWNCCRRTVLKRIKKFNYIKVNNYQIYVPKKEVDNWNNERNNEREKKKMATQKLDQIIGR